MNGDKLSVSVVIVSFNTKELTRRCLRALFSSDSPPMQVIVVDNGSHDNSADMVASDFPQVELIRSDTNLGFARANNLAIKTKANQPFVWLLNSDTEIGAKTLKQLVEYLEHHEYVAGAVPRLNFFDGREQSVGGYFPSTINVLVHLLSLTVLMPKYFKKKFKGIALYPQNISDNGIELDYITGAAALFKKSVLDEVGLLGEDYFMYFEETDLCWRIKKTGKKLMALNTDPVKHVYGGSFSSAYDKKRLRIFLDSLVLFVKKNYDKKVKSIVILVTLLKPFALFLRSIKRS